MSWFCRVSSAISASMASGESGELAGSEVTDREDAEGRLARLDTELRVWEGGSEVFRECSRRCATGTAPADGGGGQGSGVTG